MPTIDSMDPQCPGYVELSHIDETRRFQYSTKYCRMHGTHIGRYKYFQFVGVYFGLSRAAPS